jgi:hypothetical protein
MVPDITKEYGAFKRSGATHLTLYDIPEDLNPQQHCCESNRSHDKTSVAGKGRLSGKEINKMQNYYDREITKKRERQPMI